VTPVYSQTIEVRAPAWAWIWLLGAIGSEGDETVRVMADRIRAQLIADGMVGMP
jgi:hypothetical protein